MHDDSQRILQSLADGQEVLGINAVYLSTGLRNAFSEGAQALAQLQQLRALMRVIMGAPLAAGLTETADPLAAQSPQPEAPGPLAAASVVALPTEGAQFVVSEPSQPTEEVPVATADTAAETDSLPSEEKAAAADVMTDIALETSFVQDDDRAEPLPSQNDDPDADGWRPSEDAMLLDEYVGLGLTLEEVADNHGRSVSDIAMRLRQRHGVVIDVPLQAAIPEVAAPAAEPSPTPPSVAPVAAPVAAEPAVAVSEPTLASSVAAAPVVSPAPAEEPPLDDFEAVISQEMKRAGPEAVHFATGVLKHMERAPSAVAQLQDYLQTPKARTKLSDRLRLALLTKVIAKLKQN